MLLLILCIVQALTAADRWFVYKNMDFSILDKSVVSTGHFHYVDESNALWACRLHAAYYCVNLARYMKKTVRILNLPFIYI